MHVCMLILKQVDMNAAIEFYKILGLELKFTLKDSWAEFSVGNLKLGLCPAKEMAPCQTGIIIQVDDLKKLYNELKDAINFKTDVVEKVHGLMATIQDPGGNLIDLYEPTPEKVSKLVREVVERDKQGKKDTSSGIKGRSFIEDAQA